MVRLCLAVAVAAVAIVVYNRAAGTTWAVPLALVAVAYAILISFLDNRAQRDLARKADERYRAYEAHRPSRPSNQSRSLAGHHERGNR